MNALACVTTTVTQSAGTFCAADHALTGWRLTARPLPVAGLRSATKITVDFTTDAQQGPDVV